MTQFHYELGGGMPHPSYIPQTETDIGLTEVLPESQNIENESEDQQSSVVH